MAIKTDGITVELRANTVPLERGLATAGAATERAERRMTQAARNGADIRAQQAGKAAAKMQAVYTGAMPRDGMQGLGTQLLKAQSVAEARRLFSVEDLSPARIRSDPRSRIQVASALDWVKDGIGFVADLTSLSDFFPSSSNPAQSALTREAVAQRLGHSIPETEERATAMSPSEATLERDRVDSAILTERGKYQNEIRDLFSDLGWQLPLYRDLLNKQNEQVQFRKNMFGENQEQIYGNDEDLKRIEYTKDVVAFFDENAGKDLADIDFVDLYSKIGRAPGDTGLPIYAAADKQRDFREWLGLVQGQRAVLAARLANGTQIPGDTGGETTETVQPTIAPTTPARDKSDYTIVPTPRPDRATGGAVRRPSAGEIEPVGRSSLFLSDQEKFAGLLEAAVPLIATYRAELEALTVQEAVHDAQLKAGIITQAEHTKAQDEAKTRQKEVAEAITAVGDVFTNGIKGAKDFNDALDSIGLGLLDLAGKGLFGQGALGGVFNQLFGVDSGGAGLLSWLAGPSDASSGGSAGGVVWGGIGSLFGSLFGGLFGGSRAGGGQVLPGKLYQVGETGREWFAPSVPGQVIPNHVVKAAAGSGGGSSQPITFNISMAGANGDRTIAEIAAAAVKRGLTSVPEINRQHRIRFA